jgi:hypothetical protein
MINRFFKSISPQLPFPLEKLYTHPVGILNEGDANARTEVLGIDREYDPLFLEFVTKSIKFSPYMKAKVIHTPSQAPFRIRLLTRSLAANNDGGAFEGDEYLRGTANFCAADYFTTQFVGVPGCSGLRVLTNEMNVVESDAGISHNGFLPPAKCY